MRINDMCGATKARAVHVLLAAMLASLAFSVAAVAQTAPTFAVLRDESAVKFSVKASVSVSGTFNTWESTLVFASTDPATGVLDIKIQAASVNTGSGLKDRKLKGEDFFDAGKNPLITFHSTKIAAIGPDTYEMDGDFTVRGVTKQEKLTLTVAGAGTGSGHIKGAMAFNRKDYGINGEIPLVHIADRVDVMVDLRVKRMSGPSLSFK